MFRANIYVIWIVLLTAANHPSSNYKITYLNGKEQRYCTENGCEIWFLSKDKYTGKSVIVAYGKDRKPNVDAGSDNKEAIRNEVLDELLSELDSSRQPS